LEANNRGVLARWQAVSDWKLDRSTSRLTGMTDQQQIFETVPVRLELQTYFGREVGRKRQVIREQVW